jgi:hypothetical protein
MFILSKTLLIIVLDCGSIPNLDNGKLTLTTAGKTQKGATARVSCNKGYTKTDDIITCLNTGKWQNTSCDIVGKIKK